MTGQVGVVVIGRDEGQRLYQCLESVTAANRHVIYVDSGSTDGSLFLARKFRIDIIELDPSIPFTAARARNAGLNRLRQIGPHVPFVQFVDGDCTVDKGWISTATKHLISHPNVVAVCGRRREFHSDKSIYNRLCDLEWNTPIGLADACGGDAMYRVNALTTVGGFRESMIAGEEPELCLRLRRAGGIIERIECEMTTHDAAMTRFGQWWKRAVRAGHAYAEGAHLSKNDPVGLWRHEVQSTWFWGLLLPILAIVPAWWTYGWSLLFLLAYPVLWFRIRHIHKRWDYATFCVIAKFAHLHGMLRYYLTFVFGRRRRLIEYKTSMVSQPS